MISNSDTDAVLGSPMSVTTRSATSSGWVMVLSSGSIMSVATGPGHRAVTRMPSSQPTWRTAWDNASSAYLVIE